MKLNNSNIKIKKFSNIKSFTWMLRKNQLSLLKLKLSNKEKLRISNYAIENLIYGLIYGHFDERLYRKRKFQIFGDESDFGDSDDEYHSSKLDKVNVKVIDLNQFKESVKEILLLLINSYNEVISKVDIMVFIIKHGLNGKEKDALDLLELFIGKPYSLQLTPTLFKYVIINHNVQFIKGFIQLANNSNFNIVDQDFRDQSLSILLNCDGVNQDVLKFILDHPNYYNQVYNSKYNCRYFNFNMWMNCSGFEHINQITCKGRFNDKIVADITTRDMVSFFGLNKNLQIKLLQLKYYNTFYAERFGFAIQTSFDYSGDPSSDNKYIKLKEKRDSVNQFINDINNKDQNESLKIKSIHQFISSTSSYYYIKSLDLYIKKHKFNSESLLNVPQINQSQSTII